MPIRDILVTAIVFGAIPVVLLRPWVGILLWSWIGYMNPHRLSWGFATTMPFAQIAAIATVAGMILTRSASPLPRAKEVWLLLSFWGWMLLTTVFAYYQEPAWEHLNKVSKILFMTFVTLLLMQDARRLRLLLAVIAFSFGFYGFKGGIFAITTGGVHQVLGPPGTFFAGNTEVGTVLNMTLPLFIFFRRNETRTWMRHLLLVTFWLTVTAILITHSRGAFLGLIAVMAMLFLKSKSKVLALALVLVGVPLALSTLPVQWFGKMGTIQAYEEDNSARGRLEAWRVAIGIARDHPLVGGGFRTFSREIFYKYGYEKGRDAHSIYFQVLGEHGFFGLGLYLATIVSTMVTLRRLARSRLTDPEVRWIPGCAQMIEASMTAFLVSGAFLSLSYFDFFYHLVAISVLLRVLSRSSRSEHVAPAPMQREPAGR